MSRKLPEKPRDRALRLAVRHALRSRSRVSRIIAAIWSAGMEGNMQGRVHPEKDGKSPQRFEKDADCFISEAIVRLRGEP